jgi:DNA-binding NarL/FixJ family response regulator
MIAEKLPDIADIDISMPEMNGIALARRVTEECPGVRLLILTLYEDRSFLKQALAAGVSGYVLKRSAAENLVRAIRVVVAGGTYIDPSLGSVSARPDAAARQKTAGSLGLTERETEVLTFSARGLTNKEIAARLDLSAKTVETYKARATEKLGLKTRADVVRFAKTQGWLEEF